MRFTPITAYRYHKQTPAHPKAHPIIRFIWDEINRQRVSQKAVGLRAGINAKVLRDWRDRRPSPQLMNVEAVLNVLGYELTIREKRDD